MKICIVCDYLPYIHDTWSGAELVSCKTGELLAKNGNDVSFITLKNTRQCSNKSIFFAKSLFKNAPFIGKNFILDFAAFFSVFSLLRKINPDVIHIQAKYLFFYAALSARLLKIPYFFTVLDYYILCPRNTLLRTEEELCDYNHGVNCVDCFSLSQKGILIFIGRVMPNFLKRSLCVLRKRAVDYFMNKAEKIITFSESSKNRLLNYGYDSKQIEVLYHYEFDTSKVACIPEHGTGSKNKILFVGSLTRHKGLHVVIEAMKDVIAEIPDAKLLVIGTGKSDYINFVEELIKKYSLGRHIEFLRHKSNKDVLNSIKEADIVVVPEQWYSEFGPVILIEAKLLGKTVVASNIGSIPEYIRDGIDGFLAAHNCSEDFAKALIRLFKDRQLLARMEKSISGNIDKITKTKDMLARLEELYRQAEKKHGL